MSAAETKSIRAETVVVGAGLAGMSLAHELLDLGRKVLMIDKDTPDRLGGLAKESFGGVHMIDTPHQRRLGLKDSPELGWADWNSVAEFEEGDEWPRRWAKRYCEDSIPLIFEFLDRKKIRFLPLVNWPERGVFRPGNSVPRWHITWGTGYEIVNRLQAALDAHPRRKDLEILFDTEVHGLEIEAGRVVGVRGRSMKDGGALAVRADHVAIASGGVCGGDLSRVRANWHKPWGEPPKKLLNGAHRYGDGLMHDRVAEAGGNLTHLDLQWHYAAGIHRPGNRRPDDGISLVPPRSALWLNALGRRIMNPTPMPAYGDTRKLVENVLREPGQYSWQVMNRKIAVRELAVSGSDYMEVFRHKRALGLVKTALFGSPELVDRLIRECGEDIVVAPALGELMDKMDAKSLYGLKIDREEMAATVKAWDDMVGRGPRYFNDDQLRRIMNFRTYKGDKIRTAKNRELALTDPANGPLIAIREFVLARKSLGGIQTDLECRALRASDGAPIEGLYAVGEAAGFGGGGIHGKGSLEGTFLGGCVLTGRLCARAIAATR